MDDLLLEKFNATLHCSCGQPIRMLVESMWGNPNARATASGACGKIPTPSLSKVPLPKGDLDPI